MSEASPATVGTRSYLVCTTQRSGSELFCEELKRTRLAGHPYEWFLSAKSSASPEPISERFEMFKRWDRTPNGVLGIKLMWTELEFAVRCLRDDCGYVGSGGDYGVFAAALPGLHYIWLRRDNKVRQGISYWRAVTTWQFHVKTGEAMRLTPPAYDFEGIDRFVKLAEHDEDAWRHWFAEYGVQPLEVTYEEFARNREASLKQVLRFLGVTVPFGFSLRRTRFVRRRTQRILADEATDRYERTYRADRKSENSVGDGDA